MNYWVLLVSEATEMRKMKRLAIVFLAAALLCTAAPATRAQTPAGNQGGVKLGKVYVTGENPVIRLLDKEGGTPLTFASYWRIVWSPVGPGHVCYVTTGDGKSSADLRIALTDNQTSISDLNLTN
jgi:hypothetical protein